MGVLGVADSHNAGDIAGDFDAVADLHPEAEASDDAEHGRGLGVVAALSTRCGSERTAIDRKIVWAELALA